MTTAAHEPTVDPCVAAVADLREEIADLRDEVRDVRQRADRLIAIAEADGHRWERCMSLASGAAQGASATVLTLLEPRRLVLYVALAGIVWGGWTAADVLGGLRLGWAPQHPAAEQSGP